ncbi:hypothetical protein GCM10025867_51230 (plasmid) [Frondihabitans sucicola]|uniref:HK97 gp10 family phage protein n=1 Tax=Frondihabitans sucicola TaxID=1268041 RepID=A0ABM8GV98_9MICO|nr:hypothetical protein [Frondihabitans sucicola]BDZ52314.1 hypothetical protein GCM10025867_45550 [Frondihabitans sucicola]BDZ52882.1 hypothetical protein GCM10025867_51230 [Frondihabitans sucicola]
MTTATAEKFQLTIHEDALRRRADFQSADAWHQLLVKAGTYDATIDGGYLSVKVDTVILETMYVNKLGSASQADHQFPNEESTYYIGAWTFSLRNGGPLRIGDTKDGKPVIGWLGGVGEPAATPEQMTALLAETKVARDAGYQSTVGMVYDDPKRKELEAATKDRIQGLIDALRASLVEVAK